MRARLLDMGEVGAVRSQSLFHAVTAALRADAAPVVVLLGPQSPYVTIGEGREAAEEVDLDFCRRSALPVIRRRGGGEALLFGTGHLLFGVLAPKALAAELGDPAYLARAATMACRSLGVDADTAAGAVRVAGRRIGHVESVEIGDGVWLAGSLALVSDPELAANVFPDRDDAPTDVAREAGAPAAPATVAEALVEACETCFSLELIPAMPAPEEMDAIYEWDELLQPEHGLRPVGT